MALTIKPTNKPMTLTIDDKLYTTKFKVDEQRSHLAIRDSANCLRCVNQQCINCCPAKIYSRQDDGTVAIAYSGCLECGTCRIVCDEFNNIEWSYPTGGCGAIYRYG